MTDSRTTSGRIWPLCVVAATLITICVNYVAATGRLITVTPKDISDKYPTPITPAGYAFTIWSLIYLGLLAFSIYQMLPSNLAKYGKIRALHVAACILNCAWIFFWLSDQIAVCFFIILLLTAVLFLYNCYIQKTDTLGEFWTVKAPFGIYFGWVTAATLVNFAVLLAYLRVGLSDEVWTTIAVLLVVIAAVFGIAARIFLANYLFPLAVAWALTAIAVQQSGNTAVVVACAAGVVATLIATLSFVVNLPSRSTPQLAHK